MSPDRRREPWEGVTPPCATGAALLRHARILRGQLRAQIEMPPGCASRVLLSEAVRRVDALIDAPPILVRAHVGGQRLCDILEWLTPERVVAEPWSSVPDDLPPLRERLAALIVELGDTPLDHMCAHPAHELRIAALTAISGTATTVGEVTRARR